MWRMMAKKHIDTKSPTIYIYIYLNIFCIVFFSSFLFFFPVYSPFTDNNTFCSSNKFFIYRIPCFCSSFKQIAILLPFTHSASVRMACKNGRCATYNNVLKLHFGNSATKRIKMGGRGKKKYIIKFFGMYCKEHWWFYIVCQYEHRSKWAVSMLNSEIAETLRKVLIQKLFILQCRRHISTFFLSFSSHLICFESFAFHFVSYHVDCLVYAKCNVKNGWKWKIWFKTICHCHCHFTFENYVCGDFKTVNLEEIDNQNGRMKINFDCSICYYVM